MKKISLYALLAVAGLFFSSCDESFNDWANPQTNPQEDAIVIPGFTATATGAIDLGKVEETTVKVLSLSDASLPSGAYVDKLRIVVTPQDVEGATQTVDAVSADGFFETDILQTLVTGYFGKRPEARVMDAHVYADVMDNGQAALVDAGTIALTITPKASKISEKYFLVGGPLDWAGSAASKEQEFSHSDADVYDDPVFTYVITSTGSEMWFAFGDEEACDAITNDGDWSKLFGTTGESTDLSGSFDFRYNLDGDHSFCVDGKAMYYRVTINVMDYTYEITPLNVQPFVYFIGATDGWNNDELNRQRLETVAGDGVYTGYIYVADPNGWGIEFKFQKSLGDWGDDSQLNSNNVTAVTGDFEKTGDNFKASAGEGVYYVTYDMGNNTLNGLKVNTMGLIGDFNSWGGDVEMTWNPTDYCYEVTDAPVNANGWKFRVNSDWVVNLGSNDSVEPSTVLNDLVANGKNIGVAGSTIKLYPTRKTSDKIYCTVE